MVVDLYDINLYIYFQYDLGGGAVQMQSKEKLNDGEWHTVAVSREKQEGLLKVDNVVGR